MLITTSFLFNAIKDQIVSPALVQLPNFFIDIVNGILKLFDFGGCITGGRSEVVQSRQFSFDFANVLFDASDGRLLCRLKID